MTHCPSKHDWLQTVENDLSQLDLGLSKDAIKSFSKDGFKAVVKKKLYLLAHKYLTERKTSKLINLHYYNFQEYLSSDCLTLQQKLCCFNLE